MFPFFILFVAKKNQKARSVIVHKGAYAKCSTAKMPACRTDREIIFATLRTWRLLLLTINVAFMESLYFDTARSF